MSTCPVDQKALKHVATAYGAPASVISRALVNYGLANLSDSAIDAALSAAAEAERARRSAVARRGGQLGGGSNKGQTQAPAAPAAPAGAAATGTAEEQ